MTPQLPDRIRCLNDLLRTTGAGGRICITGGIQALPDEERHEIIKAVRIFSAFTEHNDPHGEHDFGSLTRNGRKVFWKIDYYDPSMETGSEDPSDNQKTVRVLTIMLAEEY